MGVAAGVAAVATVASGVISNKQKKKAARRQEELNRQGVEQRNEQIAEQNRLLEQKNQQLQQSLDRQLREQQRARELEQRRGQVAAQRERIEVVRQTQLARAGILAAGAGQGALGSSAVAGGTGAVTSQAAGNIQFAQQLTDFNRAISGRLQRAAEFGVETQKIAQQPIPQPTQIFVPTVRPNLNVANALGLAGSVVGAFGGGGGFGSFFGGGGGGGATTGPVGIAPSGAGGQAQGNFVRGFGEFGR